jgi:hypothetical protein
MGGMGRVTITCPNTGQEISTGIEIDAVAFENLPDVVSRVRCTACGLEHVWWKREAHFDVPPAPERAQTLSRHDGGRGTQNTTREPEQSTLRGKY